MAAAYISYNKRKLRLLTKFLFFGEFGIFCGWPGGESCSVRKFPANVNCLVYPTEQSESIQTTARMSSTKLSGTEIVGMSSKRANARALSSKKYKRRYALVFMILVLICSLIVPLSVGASSHYYPLAGGVWGFVCSAFVVIEYLRNPQHQGPPLA